MSDERLPVQAAGEEIHLPGPSVKPALTAFALTLVLLGIVEKPPVAVAGAILLIVVVLAWIRDTRREIDSLPAHH
ncbi:MAG: hypothetical protein LT070_08660 [Solirubrobacteraceae bacterium]|nr:hypothetical protein [Solirubrobacteraceae bacterium]